MIYEGTVYRPPSEANSLIIQATIGCSHNKCTFCSMYKDKKFKIRALEDIVADLEQMAIYSKHVRRIFLADGDALVIKTPQLEQILLKIKKLYPHCERVAVYASPKSVLTKTPDELKHLANLGIGIGYVGLESGSDRILKEINKGHDSTEIITAVNMLKQAGIMTSVTAISGLVGKANWKEHAIETGKVLTKMNPDYIGLLTLHIEQGTPLADDFKSGKIQLLSPIEIAEEAYLMIKNIDSEGSVIRTNHASNYFVLAGTLNADKQRILSQLEDVINSDHKFRDEYSRRL